MNSECVVWSGLRPVLRSSRPESDRDFPCDLAREPTSLQPNPQTFPVLANSTTEFSGYAPSLIAESPRVGLYSNQGLVELGACEINKLRRPARVPFYEWTPVSGIPLLQNKSRKSKPDRMKLAREDQSILDSGVVKTRAELARHLGVSRARVTQV